ncbi:MAG: flotillin family protein [Gemmatimonadetes bacterium]|nr:flotillin family protein [Gemmatimonadota bacterium]
MFNLDPFSGVVIGGMVLFATVVLISTIRRLTVIVPPNAAAVITGRGRALSSGRRIGYRVVSGGRTLRVPIIEEVKHMSLATIPIELSVHNAFSKGGIPLTVQAVANVKIASEPEASFHNAVERLLGKTPAQIEGLAKETLSANLRGVLATLTPEEVNEDRLRFAAELTQEADQDLHKLGLQLDTLKIQNVSDDVGYLAAVGRRMTAEVIRQAEIAESDNRRQQEVAKARNEKQVAEEWTQTRVRQAQLNQEGEAAERLAKVNVEIAEVERQRALEQQHIERDKLRLQAETVIPAQAEQAAAEAAARGAAASILENGRAQAQVLQMLAEQIRAAGDQAVAVFLAEKLPALLGVAVEAVKGIEIDRVVVLDGGRGDAVAAAANQRVHAALRVIEAMSSVLGLDVQKLIEAAARQVTTAAPALEVVPTPRS